MGNAKVVISPVFDGLSHPPTAGHPLLFFRFVLLTSSFPLLTSPMLPARRRRVLGFLLTAYIRWSLRRHFERILLFGDRPEYATDGAYPLIFFSNHQTWWDGFLEVPLSRHHGQQLSLMMEEANLRRFQAFRSVGVFGVDLTTTSGRSVALLHAAKLLRSGHPRRALYLYPHGRLLAPHEPWPDFQGGVAELLRLCPAARAVPVAKELFHGKFRDPEAWLQLGPPIRGDSPQLEAALHDAVAALRGRLAAGDEAGAVTLLPRKRWSPGRT